MTKTSLSQERKIGIVVYDDLNNPHMVEADHETIMDKVWPRVSTTLTSLFRGLFASFSTAFLSVSFIIPYL